MVPHQAIHQMPSRAAAASKGLLWRALAALLHTFWPLIGELSSYLLSICRQVPPPLQPARQQRPLLLPPRSRLRFFFLHPLLSVPRRKHAGRLAGVCQGLIH
jgi:hypothetical protein